MFQVAVSGGAISVLDVPDPTIRPGGVLVRTSHSLISAGTESANVGSGGRENLVMKAIRNPQLVKKVVDRVKTAGLQSTMDLVRSKMANDNALGYASAGVVIEVAPDVTGVAIGDRVACCGAGYANHAGINFVPRNLIARLTDQVSFEEAAFGTLGAIALQGIRRCAPVLGDTVVVLGLGLLGQLTVQMLRASGVVVIGVDVKRDRVERAGLDLDHGFTVGERDFVAGVLERTGGLGADGVIVTAGGGDATLLNHSFDACRKKGRVVLVGDVPIRIQRDKIYKKELDFFISTSYGPGRYDPDYEERGLDYPLPYVRWTEGRNLQEVIRLMGVGALDVKPLIDKVFPVEQAPDAYAMLASATRPIGLLLDYHLAHDSGSRQRNYVARSAPQARSAPAGGYRVGVVGYGNYFRAALLPLVRKHAELRLAAVCSRNGLTVRGAVERDGFAKGTTDYRELIADSEVDIVYVATRHDEHYAIARAAIEAGKAVFVEKPMTMTAAEGRALADLVADTRGVLTVGFNRRFSPHAIALAAAVGPIAAPKTVVYRVNAGALPPEHWLLDPVQGGGRLLGEGVHFFDFISFVVGRRPTMVSSTPLAGRNRDEGVVTLGFDDGSVGTLIYTGGGHADAGKERVEVFAGGASFVLDDFRTLVVHGAKAQNVNTKTIDKGQAAHLENFVAAVAGRVALGVTAEDGYWATWCAEQARRAGKAADAD